MPGTGHTIRTQAHGDQELLGIRRGATDGEVSDNASEFPSNPRRSINSLQQNIRRLSTTDAGPLALFRPIRAAHVGYAHYAR